MATHDTQPLVADETAQPDDDSLYVEDIQSSTQSISSSILQYRQENGRTYHGYKDGKYNVPNDDQENERLDLQHAIFLRTFDDNLGFAPPNDPDADVKNVLDIGTGTGIWAIDFADEHPGAEIIGVDLSPSQPSFVPPNVRFIIDDIEEEWQYSTRFDYIHSRMMNSSVADWSNYAAKIYDNLAPGGYVELQEINVFATSDDATLKESHALHRWAQLLQDASDKLGRPYFHVSGLKAVLEKAGFEDVTEANFKWPSNPWPKDPKHKELGLWNNENAQFFLEAASMAPLTRALGWSREEVTVFVSQTRREVNDKRIHAYWPIISVYGRKPKDA
ncbi:S-adenosyl-L-methionine-dependent methyltransferase [Fusarium flagelliforme]|uniref:S-adenosyl-L-methionine-dependent methyltransferase n=1 Tax=Fusarium flagelliforme TaxID=2675880 RepID=UPI001E8E2562|nr:S-adenosyl-L-methionine-dependent methyltransferase [Fusarium flagelliforme]KAH7184674.1 S-adenosyl-L-methionine-dependent methyltransferase [Fusarium flagelliforme]